MRAMVSSRNSGSDSARLVPGVSMKVGEMALTLMPYSPHSMAAHRVMCETAAFAMQYIASPGSATIEKWVLRKACEDLLPPELIWRKKAQFDEGSGTVAALDEALGEASGLPAPIDRAAEGALYERLLREQYADPDLILGAAGRWVADRVET